MGDFTQYSADWMVLRALNCATVTITVHVEAESSAGIDIGRRIFREAEQFLLDNDQDCGEAAETP